MLHCAVARCAFKRFRVLALVLRQHILATPLGKNQSAAMAGKIPKPSDVDAANIQRPTVQQLSAEQQKALDDTPCPWMDDASS